MSNVCRQRSKQGLKPKTIHLTKHEYDSIREIAEENLRSTTAQIVWLIQQSIKESSDESR